MAIRATIDANILISALLAPDSPSPPSSIVRRGLAREFDLVVSEQTILEIRDKTANKPFLAQRLSTVTVEAFISILISIAEIVPTRSTLPPVATRDPKDDYLLAPEIVSKVDHLVTGDRDLLEYTGIERGFILTAAQFLRMLDDRSADLPTIGT